MGRFTLCMQFISDVFIRACFHGNVHYTKEYTASIKMNHWGCQVHHLHGTKTKTKTLWRFVDAVVMQKWAWLNVNCVGKATDASGICHCDRLRMRTSPSSCLLTNVTQEYLCNFVAKWNKNAFYRDFPNLLRCQVDPSWSSESGKQLKVTFNRLNLAWPS